MPTVRLVGPFGKPEKKKRLKAEFVPRRYRNPTTTQSVKEDEQHISLRTPAGEVAILTPPAAARRLGCSEPRVIQLITARKLRASRLGRVWLILESDLEDYLNEKSAELRERFPFLQDTIQERRSQRGKRRSK